MVFQIVVWWSAAAVVAAASLGYRLSLPGYPSSKIRRFVFLYRNFISIVVT